ncbi:MAG: hypothetical protein FJ398_05035 [Verrucomicrobia bacterium]|nr:hypothetical protein [Verrucomicrobiota bacterium]
MNRKVRSLSEHLCYIALAKSDVSACVQLLEGSFQRFGPVEKTLMSDRGAALKFLLPLKSFTTRYLVFELNGWCLCVTDMIGENCFVDVYALSRKTRCPAMAAEFGATQRSFRFMEGGEVKRSIDCYRDGSDWFFEEMGARLDFESAEHYSRPDRSERLTPDLVTRYLSQCSEIPFPLDVRKTAFASIHGIQRCLDRLRVPLEQFFVDDQL